MNLFDNFRKLARNKKSNLGIGLGESEKHNIKIFNACLSFLKEYNSNIFIFGTKIAINHIQNYENYDKDSTKIELIPSKNPENEVFNFLSNQMINGIVRGSFSSNSFLKNVKHYLNIKELNRLALLETFDGIQFFYGPVGIDECNSIDNKITFINKAIQIINSLNIKPKISILSGGRLGDVGRDSLVDKTINIANEVVEYMRKNNGKLDINHDEILIENAIKNKSNIIIAPDGISGNLIYRTLVHLGGGKAYGAIYMGIEKPIIDTSRVGKSSEILGALVLALALVK